MTLLPPPWVDSRHAAPGRALVDSEDGWSDNGVRPAFALLGLRQLFFLVEGLLDRLVYLSYGLALILAFIGFKLVAEGLHGAHVEEIGSVPVPLIGIGPSLTFIVVVLVVVAGASMLRGAVAPAELTDE